MVGRGRDTGDYRNSDSQEDQGQHIREKSHSSHWKREALTHPQTCHSSHVFPGRGNSVKEQNLSLDIS